MSACSLAEYAEAQRPRWRVGLSGVYTSTVLSFGSFQAGETRYAAVAELAFAPTARLSLVAAFGVGAGGRLLAPDGTHDFGPGTVGSLGASYRLLDGATPVGHGFLVGGATLSYTGTTTQVGNDGPTTPYNAVDLRASLAGGLTWARVLSGYAVARAFGGPVYWHYQGAAQLGTDTHHYQVGGGLALLVAHRVELYAEGIPLGEQALSAGAAVAF